MTGDNITRRHLANAINGQIGFSKQIANTIVDAFFDQLRDALLAEDDVKLVQFGTFKVRRKSPRIGRNPRSGKSIEITRRSMVSFKPSKTLRDRVNRGV